MKKLLCALIVGCALVAPAASFAASFEGKVSFSLTSGREKPQQLSYSLKGGRIRMEMPGQKGTGAMIMDLAKKESIVLMEEEKMYMVMPMPDESAAASDAKSSEGKLEKTGEKEKILGYDAEKYIATDRNSKTELWLAEGLGTFMAFNQESPMMGGGGRRGGGAAASGWERALAGKDLFPLRVISRDGKGRETMKMEVTAINKQTLPDSLFSPPADYKKFDMGGMMKGLMPGGIPGLRE